MPKTIEAYRIGWPWHPLVAPAWEARENAKTFKTKVGCAVWAHGRPDEQHVFAGCNIEHKFRSHCIHAEVNALSSMVAARGVTVVPQPTPDMHILSKTDDVIRPPADSLFQPTAYALLIVAERDKFTPCGACMDWIFELGGPHCWVGFQGNQEGSIEAFQAYELMPHYPC